MVHSTGDFLWQKKRRAVCSSLKVELRRHPVRIRCLCASLLVQLADPDVAESDGIAVILEGDGLTHIMRSVCRAFMVSGGAGQFTIPLDDYTIEDHRDMCLGNEFVAVKARGDVDDVVGVPFTGFVDRVHHGRILTIDSAGETVGVGLVVVGIQHLDFIAVAAQENTAVAAALVVTFYLGGSGPFHMELAVAEAVFGTDIAGAGNAFHGTVFDDPLGLFAVHSDPLIQIGAVKENDRALGSFAGLVLSSGIAGIDLDRYRAGTVMDAVLGIRFARLGLCQREQASGAYSRRHYIILRDKIHNS